LPVMPVIAYMIDLQWLFQHRQSGAEPDSSATRLHVNGGLLVAAPRALLRGISSRPKALRKVRLSHIIGD
jgi:hypothetical protein